MAMRGTLINKAMASRLYFKELISPDDLELDDLELDNLSSQDLDDGGGKGSGTPDATP